MKKLIFIVSGFISVIGLAQSKDVVSVLANTRSLHRAVFATKDSAALEKLFAAEITYGHSSGKIESRQAAIKNITQNKSTYADLEMGSIDVQQNRYTAVTRHIMSANEVTADGTTKPLKLLVMLVWVKEKNEWKLMSRQAVRI